MASGWLRPGLTVLALAAASGCDRSHARGPLSDDSGPKLVALPAPEAIPAPRKNMVWVPGGSFVAGTPPEQLPRNADEELPGVPVVLHGFYIDQYPDPNEPGAIQTTALTRDQAQQRCEAQGKRLCSELEWERACKGSSSSTYETGDSYRPEDCGVAVSRLLAPTGSRVGCHSSFDVHDMHGGAFEWTSSNWGRGDTHGLATVRGGSGAAGEVIGRCANAAGRKPDSRSPDIGFRCCAGDSNEPEVNLEVWRSPDAISVLPFDASLASSLQQVLVRDPSSASLADRELFHFDRLWKWHPIGNEELVLGAGCCHGMPSAGCGLAVARMHDKQPELLAFASSGRAAVHMRMEGDRKSILLLGVDEHGGYHRNVVFAWGRVDVGEPDRNEFRISRDAAVY